MARRMYRDRVTSTLSGGSPCPASELSVEPGRSLCRASPQAQRPDRQTVTSGRLFVKQAVRAAPMSSPSLDIEPHAAHTIAVGGVQAFRRLGLAATEHLHVEQEGAPM